MFCLHDYYNHHAFLGLQQLWGGKGTQEASRWRKPGWDLRGAYSELWALTGPLIPS